MKYPKFSRERSTLHVKYKDRSISFIKHLIFLFQLKLTKVRGENVDKKVSSAAER